MWKNRLRKFLDNPLILFPFLRTRLWYRLVADRRGKGYASVRFLSAPDTMNHIIANNRSLIRAGDGTFGYLSGASIYFSDWRFRYDRRFAAKLKMVLTEGQNEDILFCYPHRFIIASKAEFQSRGAGEEWPIWVNAKATLGQYLRPDWTYGDALCFHPRYNPEMDFTSLKRYLLTKHVIIVTANISRFSAIRLGKSLHFVEAPGSDAWQRYEELERQGLDIVADHNWERKEVLFMISAAEAAKVMVYDLTKAGYTAWDTGQFFDLAAKEIAALS